jgi:VIT1/CCC1 family predicted Fe2+/Mn2+ transporter
MEKKILHEKAALLGDAVFSANDGIITTFAVVAGSAGANLDTKVVLILGFANLFADGLSMASGNYLGKKSENDFQSAKDVKFKDMHSPVHHGIVTFVSFVIAGFMPLIPFVFHLNEAFVLSSILVFLALFTVGALRSLFTSKNFIKGGMEVLLVGGAAAIVAYAVGYLIDLYVL